MNYGAYYDESDEKPAFSLAGYAAASDTWLHLGWKWQDLLKFWNLEYFKASECENLLKQFAQYRDPASDVKTPLNKNERARMIEIKTQFVDAICSHHDDLQGYGAVVIVKDFEKIISEDAAAKSYLMEKPYYICFQLCLIAAAMPAWYKNKDRVIEDRVYIKPIFDSHKEYSLLAKSLYDKFIVKNPRAAEVLQPPDYADDKRVSALQVADTLTYEARKLLTRKINDPNDDYVRPPMTRLSPAIYRIYKLDYQALKMIVARQDSDSISVPHVKVEEIW
jgi:uncharacterized protein DUF3800